MPFSNKDKAVITPVQTIRFAEDTDRIFKDKPQKGRTGHFA